MGGVGNDADSASWGTAARMAGGRGLGKEGASAKRQDLGDPQCRIGRGRRVEGDTRAAEAAAGTIVTVLGFSRIDPSIREGRAVRDTGQYRFVTARVIVPHCFEQ